ncbi:hypothetical protein PsorP6_006549 [Peronosclerospora sorghi]|uniref:Uncharacterized protein n=1 Tax=Peronosclerospora sorghi TaxID=230839 RepID=A0ACC0W4J2_9STRA|nr:hypothetical protein PsorP6_006549 [Peronosclerospora sorghi]
MGLRPVASRPSFKSITGSMQYHFYSKISDDADFAVVYPSRKPQVLNTPVTVESDNLDDEDDDVEDMVAVGPSGVEYGGPTRGGKLKEPTRFGDWERKGRCSDF